MLDKVLDGLHETADQEKERIIWHNIGVLYHRTPALEDDKSQITESRKTSIHGWHDLGALLTSFGLPAGSIVPGLESILSEQHCSVVCSSINQGILPLSKKVAIPVRLG